MQELQPEDIEDLLQELEGENGAQESPVEGVEALLQDLQADAFDKRLMAVRGLAKLEESSLAIVEALVAVRDSDPTYTIKNEAEEALRAPVHQACLQEYPHLVEATETALEQTPGSERVTLPAHFRMEVRRSTLHRVLSAGLTLLLLLLFGYSAFAGMLFAGRFSGADMCALVLVLLSGYWLLVAFANSTRITASREELIVERGPFPFPSRRFYSGKVRLDPAAYREIWTTAEEEKRGSWTGSGGSSDLVTAIVEVFLGALLESVMEPPITYTLYARAKDGTDKLLLAGLEGQEESYLRRTLQDLLEAAGGPQAREGVDEVTIGPVDLEPSAKEVSEVAIGPVDLEASANEISASANVEISPPAADWKFWLDFVAASLLGGLTLGALSGFVGVLGLFVGAVALGRFVAGEPPVAGLGAIGGAIGGAVGGIVAARIHWLGLRGYVSLTRRWVLVCCVVGTATWAITTGWAAADWGSLDPIAFERDRVQVLVAAGIIAGAVGGAVSGMMQARILRQQISRVANWWLLANTVGWAAGGAIFLPTFWACLMGLEWGISTVWEAGGPPSTLESAFRSNAAICAPVCGLLLLIVPIWARIQAIRRR